MFNRKVYIVIMYIDIEVMKMNIKELIKDYGFEEEEMKCKVIKEWSNGEDGRYFNLLVEIKIDRF